MADIVLPSNFARGTVTGSLTTGSTSIPVDDVNSVKFPLTGEYVVRLDEPLSVGYEFVLCNGRTGNNLNVLTRGIDNTSARAFPAGAVVRAVMSSTVLDRLIERTSQPQEALVSVFPSFPSNGQIIHFNNANIHARWDGSAWKAFDEESGIPLVAPPATWTPAGANTVTYANVGGGLGQELRCVGSSANMGWLRRTGALPASYTATVRFTNFGGDLADYGGFQLGISDGTKVTSFGIFTDLGRGISNHNSFSDYGSNLFSYSTHIQIPYRRVYFRIVRSVGAGTRTFHLSYDGVTFKQVFTHAINTFLTETEICVGTYSNSGGVLSVAVIDHLEVV